MDGFINRKYTDVVMRVVRVMHRTSPLASIVLLALEKIPGVFTVFPCTLSKQTSLRHRYRELSAIIVPVVEQEADHFNWAVRHYMTLNRKACGTP